MSQEKHRSPQLKRAIRCNDFAELSRLGKKGNRVKKRLAREERARREEKENRIIRIRMRGAYEARLQANEDVCPLD